MIKEILKKYKVIIIILSSLIIFSIIFMIIFNLINKNNKLIKYENNQYEVLYDKSWKLSKSNEKNLLFKHEHGKIKIDIISLDNDSSYLSIDDFKDELVYNLKTSNKDYKLIKDNSSTIGKNHFNGYELLYENGKSQVLVKLYKNNDKLIVVNYESDNKYFDILLDSAENITYNFNIKDKKYDLESKILVENKKLSYSKNDNLDKSINKNKSYEISSNNYIVKYSVPSNFELNSFDSISNYFTYKDLENIKITMNVSIRNVNIFEYLDKNYISNVYSNYNVWKKSDKYKDFKELLSKVDNYYIYKNRYIDPKHLTFDKDFNKKYVDRIYENYELIHPINKNHIAVIKLSSTDTKITKKLIDSIKIDEAINCLGYITSTIKSEELVSSLKRYTKYDKETIDEVTIKLPKKYKEIQDYNNIYKERKFGLNYIEEKDIYDYEVEYRLTSSTSKIDSDINTINSTFTKTYGKYNYLTKDNDFTVNNKKFTVYNGGYTNLGGIMFTGIDRFYFYINKKVLYYELSNGGYLIIEISGNGKEIDNNIINEVTNFNIKKIDNYGKKE